MKTVIKAGGGPTKIAAELGLAHSSVLGWSRVPAEHCLRVSDITGIPLHALRPDVYRTPAPAPAEVAA